MKDVPPCCGGIPVSIPPPVDTPTQPRMVPVSRHTPRTLPPYMPLAAGSAVLYSITASDHVEMLRQY